MKKRYDNRIERKIDNLGRVVIPKSFRDSMGIEKNGSLLMSLENNKLIITKYNLDKFDIIINFAKVWVDNYVDDTIIVISSCNVLCVFGNNEADYIYEDINREIFDIIKNPNFSYEYLQNYELFYNGNTLDFGLIGLNYPDIKVEGIIIISDNNIEFKNKFIFSIINSLYI